MINWEPTKYGGYRRAGVAQNAESAGDTHQRHGASRTPPGSKFVIKINEKLGLPGCEYLIRWRLETPWFSIRLHHWIGPDDDRAFHDHPWNFYTFVIKGGYIDRNPSSDIHMRAGDVAFRPANHRHTVFPDLGGAWTLVVTGPKIRKWGFWYKGKFWPANRWFFRRGHHPCE